MTESDRKIWIQRYFLDFFSGDMLRDKSIQRAFCHELKNAGYYLRTQTAAIIRAFLKTYRDLQPEERQEMLKAAPDIRLEGISETAKRPYRKKKPELSSDIEAIIHSQNHYRPHLFTD